MHLEILQLLIGSGADVNAREGNWTALYLAAEEASGGLSGGNTGLT
jgi:hypothetical protein